MGRITLEKDVPLTKVERSPGKIYPFNKLKKKGWSLHIRDGVRRDISKCARTYAQRHNLKWKFSAMQIGAHVRIWRIK